MPYLVVKLVSVFYICILSLLFSATATHSLSSRRSLFRQAVGFTLATTSTLLPGQQSSVAATTDSLIPAILEAQTTLHLLLNNWDRATVDCTFADVPRELLEQKNKELLLEKASTFALFDKSVSVESCKTSNKIVRSYLGLTGVGPMVGIDKKIRRALDLVQPDADQIDSYVAETELFSEAVSKAASLSYAAGLDFDSVNNFEKGNDDRNPNSNLEQARIAIQEAAVSLDKIVAMLVVP